MKTFKLTFHKTMPRETEKAIGFNVISGASNQCIGIKWLPKSKIVYTGKKFGCPNTVEIEVPSWLLDSFAHSKQSLDGVDIDFG